jgi:hypothetical protein
MSVDQSTPRRAARSPEQARLVKYHDYIDEKIESTRRLVKVVDLATALVGMAVVLLLFLAGVIVAEHWLVRGGLSNVARWVLFAGVVAYVGQFAYRKLWPLVARAINPVYAAQAIEQGAPALKNSLINLLSFRQKRTDVSDAVYRTLEEQAAQGLTRVQVDASVDQSNLIRLGYTLIAIVAIAALYKIFSPKDPFDTAERVLAPWAHVVPASRVQISDIKPGTTTVSVGESVDVSADVRGLRDDESVVLRYTTDDGQTVNRAVAMKGSNDGVKYSCRLSEGGDFSTGSGVTRSLTYWLEAGDARSLTYPVTVVTAASILVERVDYHYPKYTGLVDRSVEAIGDIRAIEGTRVTVHARANGAIRDAGVDFDADGRRDLSMTSAENQAQATFELQLRDDRETPRHASYVLRFTNDEGRTNIDPVKHAINVEPDISPEVEIRSPQEKSRDVRADENVAIEVDATDPDYKLAAVRLKGVVAEQDVINESLLKGQERRFIGRFAFKPSDRGLKAGDVLEYWIEADDNRTPNPNTTASERRSLRIVSPNPAQPPPDRIARNDRQPQDGQQPKDQQQQGGRQEKGQQPGQNQQGGGKKGQSENKTQDNAAGGEGQQGKDNNEQQNKGQGQEQGGGGNSSKPNDAGGKSQDGKSKDQQGQPGDQSQEQDSGEQKNDANQNGAQSKGEQQSKGGQTESGKQGQKSSNEKQTGAGTAGGESSKDGTKSAGTRPDQAKQDKQGDAGKGGDTKSGKKQSEQKGDGASGEQNAPVSSQGDNDAEAFSRIQKHLEQKGELKREGNKEGQDKKEQGEQGDSKGQRQQQDRQNGSKTGEQQPQQSGAKSGQRGEKADKQPGEGEKEKQETSGDQEKPEKSPGGQETTSKGSPGGGNEEKPQGSPNSEQQRKPTEKPEQSPSKGDNSNQQESPAGSNSKKESDSHGDQGGDKSGGGEEGSGQKAQRDGTGSAGQNQSADEGAGQSGEKGKGETSSNGGQDAKSDQKTGSTDGKTQGKGSQQREGTGDKPDQSSGSGNSPNREQHSVSREAKPSDQQQSKQGGQQPGKQDDQTGKAGDEKSESGKEPGKPEEKSENKNGEQQPGNQGKGQQPQQPQSHQDDTENGQRGGGNSGGGRPGNAANPSPSITGEAEKGDDANLEYARKQTELVVNKMADQLNRKKVDQQLLKDLGWSEAEMKKFVERWQQRKIAAERTDDKGEAAKRELDDALRSLGLQRGDLQQGAAQKDTMRDLKQGYHGPVPDRYKERLKAYNQGVSRARQDGE